VRAGGPAGLSAWHMAAMDEGTTAMEEPKRRPWVLIGVFWSLWTAVAVVATAAWFKRSPEGPSQRAPAVVRPNAPAKAASVKAPSWEATEKLGRRFERLINTGDQEGLADLIDWQAKVEREFTDTVIAREPVAAVIAKERESERAGRGVTGGFIAEVDAGATFSFRRVLDRDGQPVALCRMVTIEGSPIFYELIGIARDGVTRIADIYLYTSGETLSDLSRRLVTPDSPDADVLKSRSLIREMTSARSDGRWADVVQAYDRLPEALRREKAFQILAAGAAWHVDPTRFIELVEEFETTHPGDPAVLSLKVAFYQAREEYADMAKAAERFDAHVGGDAVLKSQWAWAELKQGKITEAERLLSAALREEPNQLHAHGMSVVIAVVKGDETLAMERLREIDERFGADPAGFRDMLAEFEAARPFLESEAFRQWEEEIETGEEE